MINNDFNEIVFDRHSIKVYDKNVKIKRDEMLKILDEATKAPSSVNMQPWRFVVVDSEEGKNKLRPLIMFNGRQNDTSSAMILVFGDMNCYEKADEIYDKAVREGHMSEDVKKELMSVFLPFYKNAPREKMNDIVKIDSALMTMQLMLVARKYGYDTCPIGGFDRESIAETFGLDPKRYVPVIIVSIGKADYEAHESVRLNTEELVKFI